MQKILAVLFAVMIGLTFAGSTFAAGEKKDAPPAAPAGDKKEDKKDEKKKDEKKKDEKK